MTIYGVGIDLSLEEAGALTALASRDAANQPLYQKVEDPAADLAGVLDAIGGQMRKAATEAVIYDTISQYYDFYVPSGPSDPYQQPGYVSHTGGVVTITVGDITNTPGTYTFYLKLKDEYANTTALYPTNASAVLEYKNYQGLDSEYGTTEPRVYEEPELPVNTGSVTVNSYLVNADGEYIALDGTVVAKEYAVLLDSYNEGNLPFEEATR